MAKNGNKGGKTPKKKVSAQSGAPRQKVNPESYLSQTPTWAFRSFDWDGIWGEGAFDAPKLRKHFEAHLSAFETMRWDDILKAAGGKSSGTNHHAIAVANLSKLARNRIDELGLKVEEVFSLRLEGAVRLYGIREGREFRILWFDPNHGDAKLAVCPSTKKHT